MDSTAPPGHPWWGASGHRRELLAGLAALLAVVLVGFVVPAGPTALDRWLGLDHSEATWTAVTALRLPWVVVAGAVVCGAVAWRRDRVRALACVLGPPLALGLAELVAKPLSGQTLGGAYSYPSGSTVGAAALGAAAVLAAGPRFRRWAVAGAAGFGLWMAAAVVARGWHYPVDALAGLVFGAAVVAVVDGGLAMLAMLAGLAAPAGTRRATGRSAGPGLRPRPGRERSGGPPTGG